MIDVEDLIALVRNYNPRCNADLIRDAYAYGMQMHEGQFRHSGEPYFTHPIAVAAILTEMRLDDATLITALLHDTVEDTRSTKADVSTRFGEEIAELVDGVTKLTNLELSSTQSKQAENFRKLFMAMSRDLRVILVKLADRLHNMRTIRSMRPDKQVWSILTRPLFLLSCIFFVFDNVPDVAKPYLWFNPLVHVVGQMRRSFYPSYSGDYVSYLYVFALGLVLAVIGVALLQRYHRDLLNS